MHITLRTFFILMFLSLSFNVPQANAQCLLCGIVGYSLGSSDRPPSHVGSGSGVLYVLPEIEKRLTAPLDVRFATSRMTTFYKENTLDSPHVKGVTLSEMFANTVPNHQKYVILEVLRVIEPSNISRSVFWFAYIEKEKVRPLAPLPPASRTKKQ